MSTEIYRLLDSQGHEIAGQVEKLTGLGARTRGLLGRQALAQGDGVWIAPCSGVHTFGMRFAIDVVLLDADMRVVRIARSLKPNRIVLPAGNSAVEVAAGSLPESVSVGDTMSLVPVTG